MENVQQQEPAKIGSWLDLVAEIDPQLAKPELWSEEAVNLIIPEDGKLHESLHVIIKNILARGIFSVLEPALVSAVMLGYHLGQLKIKQAN